MESDSGKEIMVESEGENEIMVESEGDHATVPYQPQEPSAEATVEVSKKPKERPEGSKNKPKNTGPNDDVMATPYVVEIPHGIDVVQAISQFSLRNNTGLCVLTASGTVLNAQLLVPSAASAVFFPGQYLILSMSAAFDPDQSPISPYAAKPMSVALAAPDGRVIEGLVSGPLLSSGPVKVISSSFNRRSYHKLPAHQGVLIVANTGAGDGERHVPRQN